MSLKIKTRCAQVATVSQGIELYFCFESPLPFDLVHP